MKFRSFAFKLHQGIGVLIGFLLAIIGLTGSALMFINEIEPLIRPQIFRVTPQASKVSLESILQTVGQTYPHLQLENFFLAKTANGVHTIMADGFSFGVYIDPYTGKILAAIPWGQTIEGFIYQIHTSFFAGEIGQLVVGIIGILLVTLCLTGILLWPGWKKLKSGLKIRWRARKRIFNYDLHKVIGIFSVLFLTIIAVTGVGITFWSQVESALYTFTFTAKPAAAIAILPHHHSPLALDELLLKADTAFPEAKTLEIQLPTSPQTALTVRKKLPQETDPFGLSAVHLNQYTGEVLRIDRSFETPLAGKIMSLLYPLHVGFAGGLPLRILYLAIGITPLGLLITGLTVWWNRTYGLKTSL